VWFVTSEPKVKEPLPYAASLGGRWTGTSADGSFGSVKIGIGQRAVFCQTEMGNVLWDLVPFIDDAFVEEVSFWVSLCFHARIMRGMAAVGGWVGLGGVYGSCYMRIKYMLYLPFSRGNTHKATGQRERRSESHSSTSSHLILNLKLTTPDLPPTLLQHPPRMGASIPLPSVHLSRRQRMALPPGPIERESTHPYHDTNTHHPPRRNGHKGRWPFPGLAGPALGW
jgi:hypothetical protein